MNRYQKVMVCLSYMSGVLALFAILVNDKTNKFFSFHIWQAFFLNLLIAVGTIVIFDFWLPKLLFTTNIYQRTSFFLEITMILVVLILVMVSILGILAARGVKFEIPILSYFADRITADNGGK